MIPEKHLNKEADVLILLFVRGNDRESRNFIREILGNINEMEGVEYKFQVLFVFGKNYMSPTERKNATIEWKLENNEYHDLIITGMCLLFFWVSK